MSQIRWVGICALFAFALPSLVRGENPLPQGGIVRQAGPRASRAGSASRERLARYSAPSPDEAQADHSSTRVEQLPTPDERIAIPAAPPLCELDLNLLVQDVLARHPSIEAAAAAWRAAARSDIRR